MDLDVTLLYFDDCPHWRETHARVLQALHDTGAPEGALTLRLVESDEEARELAFRGSPTVLVNGEDPFADGSAPTGMSCRMYPTPRGLTGVPPVDELAAVLRGAG